MLKVKDPNELDIFDPWICEGETQQWMNYSTSFSSEQQRNATVKPKKQKVNRILVILKNFKGECRQPVYPCQ